MECEINKNRNVKVTMNSFQMLIPTKIWEKVYVMIHSTPKEIGALMSCKIDGTNILITDIHIPKQTVTSTECLFDKDDQADIVFRVTMEENSIINGWIHSHVNMHTAFSCTDDETIAKLLDYTDDYLISICVNKKQSLNGRVDYISQNKFGRFVETVDNIPVYIVPDNMSDAVLVAIDDFVKNGDNVTERKAKVVQSRWSSGVSKHKSSKSTSKKTSEADDFDEFRCDDIIARIDAIDESYLPEMREILEDSFGKWFINDISDDDVKQWWVLQEFDWDYPEEVLKTGMYDFDGCIDSDDDDITEVLLE